MKKGICPKCASSEVCHLTKVHGDNDSLRLSQMNSVPLEYYVCFNCGFMETYVEREADYEKIRKFCS